MAKFYKKFKHWKEEKGKRGGRSNIGIGISIGSDSKKRGGCISEKDEAPPLPKPRPGPPPWPPDVPPPKPKKGRR